MDRLSKLTADAILRNLTTVKMKEVQLLIDAGKELHRRGWVPATGGNLSMRLEDGRVLITRSGAHKGHLTFEDFLYVDLKGNVLEGSGRPSAETLLHLMVYRRYPYVNAVLHVHSMSSTLISKLYDREVVLEGYELLKAFEGVKTHETRLVVPVFENSQDMENLYKLIYPSLMEDTHAFILRAHGIYTWAKSLERALINLEALDFLFECELKLMGVKP